MAGRAVGCGIVIVDIDQNTLPSKDFGQVSQDGSTLPEGTGAAPSSSHAVAMEELYQFRPKLPSDVAGK
jgi:hypothetical protein